MPEARYIEIAGQLRRQIENGAWKIGARVPSENELAATHDVHRLTARRALDELTREGLLERIRGSGTFIRDMSPPRDSLRAGDCVGLFIRATGHVWSDAARHLARHLQARGLLTVLLDLSDTELRVPSGRQPWAGPVRRALATDLAAVVVEGAFLRHVANVAPELASRRNVIVVNEPTASLKEVGFTQAHTVYGDFELGGRLATEHLLAGGHRRLLLWTYGQGPRQPGGPARLTRELGQRRFRAGCRQALRAAGLDPDECLRLAVVIDETRRSVPDLDAVFAAPDHPTGVLAMGDWRARQIYEAARRQGLRIGTDVAVVGYFDTPWATAFRPQLTSVDLRVPALAAAVADVIGRCLDAPTVEPRRVLIPPRLVVRESSAPAAVAVVPNHTQTGGVPP